MTAQKNLTNKIFFSVVVAAIAVSSAFPTPWNIVSSANAQVIMSAIPPKVELKGNPGQTLTAILKIGNSSDVMENFTISVEDFIVNDTKGTPVPIATSANNRWSLAKWISAPKTIPVDAGGLQVINISINIPLTALPGGHYAMITYTPSGDVKPGDLKKTGSLITNRVGTLVYVVVNGPVNEQANLTRFVVPKFSEQGPIEFTGNIESLSDLHINPMGTISISNPLNSKIAEIPVEVGNIFPETTREFISSWNQKWGWGRYRADLNLSYGAKGSLINSSIYFWLFPIRLIIYSLIAIVSILSAIILLNKRSNKHQLELEKEVAELKEELKEIEQQ